MRFQGWMVVIATIAMIGCTHSTKKQQTEVPQAETYPVVQPDVVAEPTTPPPGVVTELPAKKVVATNNGFLICKAKKSRFHYDWDASSLAAGQNDQNTVRYEFRSASRPAGEKGENLKVGECGWAGEALAASKKAKSQVTFKSLSDEVTQNFYKLKNGKVFKVPVRETKNGMVTAPGTNISVVR